MTVDSAAGLAKSIEAASAKAGLTVASVSEGKDFHGEPTAIFELALPDAAARTLRLELSEGFSADKPELAEGLATHLAAAAKRLRNPRPETYVTLDGIPVAFGKFAWPFHQSTSGADTYIVHGEMRLADGGPETLHAKLAASVTVTFAEIVPAMEQPFAESFIYNAIRRTVDLGQLEFLKSGNRQPVFVTTRYYSRWKKQFIFSDSTDTERLQYLLSKVYWLSGVLGKNAPVWIADPQDAQYLNTTEADLLRMAGHESGEGLLKLDGEFASATPALLERAGDFKAALDKALNFTKPQFNESMRAGEANM